jgi:hypothetical protein
MVTSITTRLIICIDIEKKVGIIFGYLNFFSYLCINKIITIKKKIKIMGWVKEQTNKTSKLFAKIIKEFGEKWNGRIGSSSSPYEYFSDYIRDNYDVTLGQCDLLCEMIKQHYRIEKFYYNEIKRK